MRSAFLAALGVALAAPAAEPPGTDLQMRAVCEELRVAAATPRDVDLALADLKKQAAAVAAARQELKTETARLTELLATVAKAGTKGAEEKKPENPTPQLERLAKTISIMKPAKSAAMMVKLPQLLAVSTLEKLPPARRAAILEKMPPDRAAEMLHALSELPAPDEDESNE
jgi:flagellar motility protein MotE (MotC chaperone)